MYPTNDKAKRLTIRLNMDTYNRIPEASMLVANEIKKYPSQNDMINTLIRKGLESLGL